jgi:phenylpropionate dioxygenase-like ring-hydroxylating dioxygenase large terminal subunit
MKVEDYTQGGAFQVEKQTVFSDQWLPLCAEGQLAGAGDFVATAVGGWGVVAVRDRQGALHVLRNACRHQNMPVVAAPAGTCETFRCRFHGWTYDLQGRFVGAPPPVAPRDGAGDRDLARLPARSAGGLLFFGLAPRGAPAALPPPAASYGGTLVTEIACNWKVCVEHLLAEHGPSADFTFAWPLLTVRRAGPLTIVEQVAPHTFLRTRLFTHVFGAPAEQHEQPAATIKRVCENLQADRAAGAAAPSGPLVDAFHARLARAVATA